MEIASKSSNNLMSIFRVKLHYLLCYCNILYFAILSYNIRNCIRKYKCEYIVYILPFLVKYIVPRAFVYKINFFFYYYLLKSVKYKVLSEYSTLIGLFPSKSVKVSRKIGWSSSIPSKSVQVLWRTLIKVFFDHLHHQSLHQKLWPSFLVQENTVNRALCFFFEECFINWTCWIVYRMKFW